MYDGTTESPTSFKSVNQSKYSAEVEIAVIAMHWLKNLYNIETSVAPSYDSTTKQQKQNLKSYNFRGPLQCT